MNSSFYDPIPMIFLSFGADDKSQHTFTIPLHRFTRQIEHWLWLYLDLSYCFTFKIYYASLFFSFFTLTSILI